MKISARNVLSGKVTSISRGPMHAEVTVEVACETKVVSLVPLEAVERLELAEGKEVYAVFEASDVLLGIPHHKRDGD